MALTMRHYGKTLYSITWPLLVESSRTVTDDVNLVYFSVKNSVDVLTEPTVIPPVYLLVKVKVLLIGEEPEHIGFFEIFEFGSVNASHAVFRSC